MNFKSMFYSAVLMAVLPAFAGPQEPAHGKFDVRTLAANYEVTHLQAKSVYSHETRDQDMTEFWLGSEYSVRLTAKGLKGTSEKDENSAISMTLANINKGKIPKKLSGAGTTMSGYSEAYTTINGIFSKEVMTSTTTNIEGFKKGFTWYTTSQIVLTSTGNIQVSNYETSCPGLDGFCGEIGQEDIYSSSTLYFAELKKLTSDVRIPSF